MPSQERDVNLRTRITREGDQSALRDIAQELEGIEGPARDAGQSVRQFLDQLEDVNPSEFADLQKAVNDLDNDLTELGKSKAFDDQREAVDKLEKDLIGLRKVLSEAWDEGSADARRYQQALDQVRQAQANFADPLIQAYRRAEAAAEKAADAVARGSEEGGTKTAEFAFQVEKLRDELEAARREGRNIGEIGTQFEALEGKVKGLRQEYARFRAIREQTDREIRDSQTVYQGYGRTITGVDDVLQNLADRSNKVVSAIGRVGLKLGAAIFIFDQAYNAGERLWRTLDKVALNLFNVRDASDKLASKVNSGLGLTALARKIAGLGDDTIDTSQALDNQRKIFEALEIPLEQFTSSVDRNSQIIQQHQRGLLDHAHAIREVANAYGLLTDPQIEARAREVLVQVGQLLTEGLPRDQVREAFEGVVQALLSELDRLPPALQGNLKAMAETLGIVPSIVDEALAEIGELSDAKLEAAAGRIEQQLRLLIDRGVPTEDLKSAFGSNLQAILDEVDRLPPALALKIQEMADTLGILPSEIEARGEEIKAALRSWGVAVEEEGRTLQERVEIFLAAFSRLGDADLEDVDLDKFREQVRGLVDDLREAGEPIPDQLAGIANKVGVVVRAYERASNTAGSFAVANREAADSSIELSERVNEAGETVTVFTQRSGAAAQGSRDAAGAMAEQGEAARESGAAAEEAAVQWERVDGQLRVTQQTAREAGEATQEAGERAKAGGEAARQSAEGSDAAAAAAERQAEAASSVSESTAAAAEGTERLAQAAASVEEHTAGAATTVSDLAAAVQSLLEPLAGAVPLVEQLAGVDLSPLRAEIQAVRGDLADLRAEAESVTAALAAAFATDGGPAPVQAPAAEGEVN